MTSLSVHKPSPFQSDLYQLILCHDTYSNKLETIHQVLLKIFLMFHQFQTIKLLMELTLDVECFLTFESMYQREVLKILRYHYINLIKNQSCHRLKIQLMLSTDLLKDG